MIRRFEVRPPERGSESGATDGWEGGCERVERMIGVVSRAVGGRRCVVVGGWLL